MTDRSEPLVSVVLPTYDRASCVLRSIESVLGQSHSRLELLVVDDASTDATPDLVSAIDDSRLRYIRLPENRGVADARNAGIAASSEEASWVAFQDSDDQWLPHKLERQLAVAAADPSIDVVLGSYRAEWDNQFVDITPCSILEHGDPGPDILDGWPIITPVWLVRRSLLQRVGGFDGRYCPIEDWDLIMRLSDHGRFGAAREPVLKKFGSPDSICINRRRLCGALELLVTTHARRWESHPRRLARRLAHVGCMKYGPGKRQAARRHFVQAARLDPLAIVPYALIAASFLGSRVLSRVAGIWPRYSSMAL